MPKISLRDAIRDALHEEMARDETIFVLGEDVIAHGGPYAVTRGLLRSIPRASQNADFRGGYCRHSAWRRPVWHAAGGGNHVRRFYHLCHGRSGQSDGQSALHVWRPDGCAGGAAFAIGLGTAHCGTTFPEPGGVVHARPWLAGGRAVDPYDAKGLMKNALRGKDPVIFIEYKRLYTMEGEVPDGDYTIPFGQADVKRQGNDVTIVASGPMVGKSLEAADMLAQSGIDVEVVDVRTLMPLDKQTIFASVEKTNRVIVTDEEAKRGGASAEIASLIAEECFDALDAPVKRVAAANVPMPFSPELEKLVVPRAEDLVAAVRQLLASTAYRHCPASLAGGLLQSPGSVKGFATGADRYTRTSRRRAMALKFGMPSLGHTMEKGKVIEWLKQEGQTVSKGEPLLVVETDKVVTEVEAPADGVVLRILVKPDEERPIGADSLSWVRQVKR